MTEGNTWHPSLASAGTHTGTNISIPCTYSHMYAHTDNNNNNNNNNIFYRNSGNLFILYNVENGFFSPILSIAYICYRQNYMGSV